LHFHPGEEMRFTAVVEIWPEVDPQGVDSVRVEEVVWEVGEEQVEAALDSLRERATQFEPVDRPAADGDVVDVILQAADRSGKAVPAAKRQEARLEVGGETLLPEFREATRGITAGERRVVHVTYPTDFENRSLAGQSRTLLLRAQKIYEKKVPALDDAFAQTLGTPDLATLRAQVRARLEA